MSQPPKDIDAAVLVQTLLEFPRPRVRSEFRFAAARDQEIWIQPVHAHTRHVAVRENKPELAIVDAIVDESGARLFDSPKELLASLSPAEFYRLASATYDVFSRIGPCYGLCDSEAWHRTIMKGLAASSHLLPGFYMASKTVLGFGTHVIQLDATAYFGCPVRELLDGHLMVIRAAQENISQCQK